MTASTRADEPGHSGSAASLHDALSPTSRRLLMGGLIILVITFGLMWVLFILPQQRRVRAQQAVIDALKVGDEIMTSAGIFGRVTKLEDEVVRVQVAPEVELRLARGAIAKRVDAPTAPPTGEVDKPPPPRAAIIESGAKSADEAVGAETHDTRSDEGQSGSRS